MAKLVRLTNVNIFLSFSLSLPKTTYIKVNIRGKSFFLHIGRGWGVKSNGQINLLQAMILLGVQLAVDDRMCLLWQGFLQLGNVGLVFHAYGLAKSLPTVNKHLVDRG